MGGHSILYPPHLKKRGDTSPVFLTKLRPWSNVKNSSHKTWQTSYLVLKPLQIQTLREKSGETWHIMSPQSKKVGGTRPPCLPPNCARGSTIKSLSGKSRCRHSAVQIPEKFTVWVCYVTLALNCSCIPYPRSGLPLPVIFTKICFF